MVSDGDESQRAEAADRAEKLGPTTDAAASSTSDEKSLSKSVTSSAIDTPPADGTSAGEHRVGIGADAHAGRSPVIRTNVEPPYGKYAETDVEDVTHADKVRKLIVIWLLSLLTGTIVLGIVGVATAKVMGVDVADVRSFFEIVFSAVIALVSTAVGFYFATEARKQGPPRG